MTLSLVLAESALELVPNELLTHPAIVSWARRKRKDPRQLILDQTYHHSAIQRLGKQGAARGRPDIIHISLLLALGSPLSLEGNLRCFVHTRDDKLIAISPRTRLPRNTDRFVGLIEQLYSEKAVPLSGPPLLTLASATLPQILDRLNPERVVALTTRGIERQLREVAGSAARLKRSVIMIGGFPEGHFSETTMREVDAAYRIDKRHLEAWTVVARAVYDFESVLKELT